MSNLLEIRLLGELDVHRDGQRLPLPASRKTRALLAYLVMTRQPQPRSRLCDLLWEGPDDPRGALRWSLAKLRPVLGDGMLADRERVGFNAAGVRVDLFDALAAAGRNPARTPLDGLRRAAELLRGELLEGLTLPGCYQFEAWCAGEREQAHALRLRVLDAVVERLAERPEEALRHARVRLAADPLAEAAHAQVVRLLGELGRIPEAMAQVDACRRLFERELGQAPGPALEQARMALRAVRSPPLEMLVATPPVGTSTPATARPLAGRRAEREALRRRLTGETPGLLVFTGEPGIGKSRLLEELGAMVSASGGRVLAGRSFEAEKVRPYGPWIDALGAVETEAGDRGALFDAVVGRLRDLAAAAPPLLVVLDDLQWIDDGSAALLCYALRQLRAAPVRFAGAVRPEELADNGVALQLMRALRREQLVDEHPLTGLDAEEIGDLLASQDVDAERILGESGGNPLYALEIAAALRRGDQALSRTLRERIAERLARLSVRTRELLPWAAALGRGFDPELVGRAAGSPAGELVTAIEELEGCGVVRATAGGVDFVHDLVRQVAYRLLSAPRRRIIHRQLARALRAAPDGERAGAGEVARHAAAGDDAELCAAAAIDAARWCRRMAARADAVAVVRVGLPFAARLPGPRRVAATIALLHEEVLARFGQLGSGGAARGAELAALAAEATALGLTDDAALAQVAVAVLSAERGDDGTAHRATLAAGAAGRTAAAVTAVFTLANTGRCLAQLERELPRAMSTLDEAEALAAGAQVPDLGLGRGLVYAYLGDDARARVELERGLADAEQIEDPWRAYSCALRLAMLDLEQGRASDALAGCRRLFVIAAKLGEGSERATAEVLVALAREDAGAPLERALQGLRDADARLLLSWALERAARLALAGGRPAEAVARAEEALAHAAALARPSACILARATLAGALLAGGDVPAARAQVEAACTALTAAGGTSERARVALVAAAQPLGIVVPRLS